MVLESILTSVRVIFWELLSTLTENVKNIFDVLAISGKVFFIKFHWPDEKFTVTITGWQLLATHKKISSKVRKFWRGHKIFHLIWHFLSKHQIKGKSVSNFVAFLEKLNCSYLQQEKDHHEGNCNLIIVSQPRKLSLSTDKQRLTTIKIVGYHLSWRL